MLARFRLSDEDRQRLGGPEWVMLDFDNLMKLDINTLSEFEEHSGIYISELGAQFEQASASQRFPLRFVKAFVWLARRLAGMSDDYADFSFQPLATQFEIVADDEPPKNRAERRATVKTSRRSSNNTNA